MLGGQVERGAALRASPGLALAPVRRAVPVPSPGNASSCMCFGKGVSFQVTQAGRCKGPQTLPGFTACAPKALKRRVKTRRGRLCARLCPCESDSAGSLILDLLLGK